jgi:hypothetical protein
MSPDFPTMPPLSPLPREGITLGTHRAAPQQKTYDRHQVSDKTSIESQQLPAKVSQGAIQETNLTKSTIQLGAHLTKNYTKVAKQPMQATANESAAKSGFKAMLKTALLWPGKMFALPKKEASKASPVHSAGVALAKAFGRTSSPEEKLAFIQKHPIVYKVLKEVCKEINHPNALEAAGRFMEFPTRAHLAELKEEMEKIGFTKGDNPRGYKAVESLKTFINSNSKAKVDSLKTDVQIVIESLIDELDLDGYYNKLAERLRNEPLPKYSEADLQPEKVANNPFFFKAVLSHPNVVKAQQGNEVVFLPRLESIYKVLTNPARTEAEVSNCRQQLKEIYEKHLQKQEEEDVFSLFPTKGGEAHLVPDPSKPIFANLTDLARTSADALIKDETTPDQLAENLKNLLADRRRALRFAISSFNRG